jgi:predicted aspartyl protease
MWVYVDTGASFTVLHTFEAKRLGVNLKRCKRFLIVAAGGRKIPVFITRVRMRIGRKAFRAEVGFCRVLGGTFNLLGRKDVFQQFRVSFDDRREVVTFQG